MFARIKGSARIHSLHLDSPHPRTPQMRMHPKSTLSFLFFLEGGYYKLGETTMYTDILERFQYIRSHLHNILVRSLVHHFLHRMMEFVCIFLGL